MEIKQLENVLTKGLNQLTGSDNSKMKCCSKCGVNYADTDYTAKHKCN